MQRRIEGLQHGADIGIGAAHEQRFHPQRLRRDGFDAQGVARAAAFGKMARQQRHADIAADAGQDAFDRAEFQPAERDPADAAKERIRRAGGDDTVRGMVFDITRQRAWPAPFTGRCLRNVHLERWHGRELELLHRSAEIAAEFAVARDTNDYDVLPVIAGEASGLVHDIETVQVVVDRIVRQAEDVLRAGGRTARP